MDNKDNALVTIVTQKDKNLAWAIMIEFEGNREKLPLLEDWMAKERIEAHEATKKERDDLGAALKVTAAACADHVNTILQLRSELADFKQEVSDAVEGYLDGPPIERHLIIDTLRNFIIIIPKPKPDPLVEIISEIEDGTYGETKDEYANKFRAALEARGLEIREKANE
jgi:hypothetical protein